MLAAHDTNPDTAASPRDERRTTPRADVHLRIDAHGEHEFWTGLTMNIAEGGVFVATHETLPPGTIVTLHVALPRIGEILTLGEVHWRRRYTGDDDVPPGLGIKFVRLDLEAAAAVHEFITTVRAPLLFET